ncbi:MAG: CHAT domain-containing protein [Pseudohongiellaceae bacterium]
MKDWNITTQYMLLIGRCLSIASLVALLYPHKTLLAAVVENRNNISTGVVGSTDLNQILVSETEHEAQTSGETEILVDEIDVVSSDPQRPLTPELIDVVYDAAGTAPGNTTTRSQLREDINSIFGTGFFLNVRAEPEDTESGIKVTFFVEPNPVLTNVDVRNRQVLPDEIVDDLFSDQYGQILNIRGFQDAILELNDWYQKNGYVLAQVIEAPQISDDGTVSLTVAEGEIESIEVRFTDKEGEPIIGKTRDFVVTSEFITEPGDIFQSEQIREDFNRAFTLGLFEDIRPSLDPGEVDPRKVKLIVNVAERETRTVGSSVGFNLRGDVFGQLSFQENNLGGLGQSVSTSTRFQRSGVGFNLSSTNAVQENAFGTEEIISESALAPLMRSLIRSFRRPYASTEDAPSDDEEKIWTTEIETDPKQTAKIENEVQILLYETQFSLEKETMTPAQYSLTLSNLAILYARQGYHVLALESFYEASDLFQRLDSPGLVFLTQMEIAQTYRSIGLPNNAVEAYHESLEAINNVDFDASDDLKSLFGDQMLPIVQREWGVALEQFEKRLNLVLPLVKNLVALDIAATYSAAGNYQQATYVLNSPQLLATTSDDIKPFIASNDLESFFFDALLDDDSEAPQENFDLQTFVYLLTGTTEQPEPFGVSLGNSMSRIVNIAFNRFPNVLRDWSLSSIYLDLEEIEISDFYESRAFSKRQSMREELGLLNNVDPALLRFYEKIESELIFSLSDELKASIVRYAKAILTTSGRIDDREGTVGESFLEVTQDLLRTLENSSEWNNLELGEIGNILDDSAAALIPAINQGAADQDGFVSVGLAKDIESYLGILELQRIIQVQEVQSFLRLLNALELNRDIKAFLIGFFEFTTQKHTFSDYDAELAAVQSVLALLPSDQNFYFFEWLRGYLLEAQGNVYSDKNEHGKAQTSYQQAAEAFEISAISFKSVFDEISREGELSFWGRLLSTFNLEKAFQDNLNLSIASLYLRAENYQEANSSYRKFLSIYEEKGNPENLLPPFSSDSNSLGPFVHYRYEVLLETIRSHLERIGLSPAQEKEVTQLFKNSYDRLEIERIGLEGFFNRFEQSDFLPTVDELNLIIPVSEVYYYIALTDYKKGNLDEALANLEIAVDLHEEDFFQENISGGKGLLNTDFKYSHGIPRNGEVGFDFNFTPGNDWLIPQAASQNTNGLLSPTFVNGKSQPEDVIGRPNAKSCGSLEQYFTCKSKYFELYIDILLQAHQNSPEGGFDVQAFEAIERAKVHTPQRLQFTDVSEELPPEQQRLRQRKERLNQPAPYERIQQEALDPDTVLLEYSLGENRSYLWLVQQGAPLQIFELPPRDEIEAKAREYLSLLTEPGGWTRPRTTAKVGKELSDMLLGPITNQLPGTRLVIVGDGVLQYLPFSALPNPNSSLTAMSSPVLEGEFAPHLEPLLLSHEIISLPSASALVSLREDRENRSSPTKELAIFADPVFNHKDSRVDGIRVDASSPEFDTRRLEEIDVFYGELPNTREELSRIDTLVPTGQKKVFADFDASLDNALTESLGDYRMVHFATHGIFNSKSPERSGIVLSGINEDGSIQPSLLSPEVAFNDLNLAGTELVVLSGCRTGLSQDVALRQGLTGLTGGLLAAGTDRVVTSLWSVRDDATKELMSRFYENMLLPERDMPAAEALRAAQISMWEDPQWQTPYFWAAFVLQGEWQ